MFNKKWQGTLPNGKYLIEYDGSSIETLTELIERLKQNLADLQAGIISD